jgi:hypothetical protein
MPNLSRQNEGRKRLPSPRRWFLYFHFLAIPKAVSSHAENGAVLTTNNGIATDEFL